MTEPGPIVVDASVTVKWFVSEEETNVDEAALLERHATGEVRLVSSAVLPFEVLGALRRGRRNVPALGDAMDALYEVGIVLLAPSRAVAAQAWPEISQVRSRQSRCRLRRHRLLSSRLASCRVLSRRMV